uniref:Uncharacterized protein n=1 Tax=Anguilla anguilla TaxID=7936 RepID=A0A0E9WWZ1_ANGAN
MKIRFEIYTYRKYDNNLRTVNHVLDRTSSLSQMRASSYRVMWSHRHSTG